jgi:hypothetical protein
MRAEVDMVDIIAALERCEIGCCRAIGEGTSDIQPGKLLLVHPDLLPDLFHDLIYIDLLHMIHHISP